MYKPNSSNLYLYTSLYIYSRLSVLSSRSCIPFVGWQQRWRGMINRWAKVASPHSPPDKTRANIVRRFLYSLFFPILHIENVIAFIYCLFFSLSVLLCAFALISYRLQ